MENKIDLEKKIKELDNILFKVGQSAQTLHMLTKPQAFYDDIHKQALGYQNSFHLKKAQRIKPTLYDGIVIFAKHVAMPMIDDEETLILKKSVDKKCLKKQRIQSLTLFGKRFTSQQELSAEQAFWLRMSNPTSKPSNASSFKIEAPKEIPKVSLVNESLKKLKFHLARFDNVVKIRTTPDACTESEWGFEHTKAVFNNEIILFLKSLKDIFNVFDRDLLNEIIELQDKDSTICKLKDIIKSMREKSKEENVKYDYCEIETKNVELEDSVAKLLSENERLCNEINHVKHVFKEQFDSIKKIRVRIKEQSDSLIDKLNLKSAENEDLKAQIQDKVFVITSLKNDLQKVKGKDIVDIVAQIQSANTIVPGMFKLDLETLAPSHAKSAKKHKKSNIWKPTGHVFTEVGLKWKPTGRTFTIVGSNATDIPSSSSLVMTGTVRFGNDHIARIMGYGDYQLGNVTISRVYYKNTCFIRNLEGVDLLSGSQDTNLYTISLDDMLKTSLICLISKASKTKSWLWHRRLSHLNFGTLNKLAKDGLARGIPRLKFHKDHLCSACALGKSKKSSHQPKAEDTNEEKLYLLHMDLCGPMRVASINGKSYILVIVDDYSRFTWIRFLRSKDEAPDAIIKCIKNIQVRLNATVRNVRTDNGTEFVNQTLREFYENVGISHQTSVARTPQQNGVVERRNRTLVEAARTISGPGLHSMTPATSSSGLVPNPIPQQPCIPPLRDDWDCLFQPMFDEYFTSPSIPICPDAPSTSIPSTQEQEHSPNISQGFGESPKTPSFRDDPLHEDSTSQGSSSNVRQTHTPFEHHGKWTKDHPIANVIGNSHSLFPVIIK
ncbi:retrovirus-related pol polyprotein from transposon TNT 1-94 [Tanacetum coccineum]